MGGAVEFSLDVIKATQKLLQLYCLFYFFNSTSVPYTSLGLQVKWPAINTFALLRNIKSNQSTHISYRGKTIL